MGSIKILIIGESLVGKSSLLMRFTQNTFSETMLSTVGMDFCSRTVVVDKQNTQLQIWDTAGQEKYRVITRAYYRGADGIMLVFDLTDVDTFMRVRGWMDSIQTNSSSSDGSVAIALIGNKVDQGSARRVKKDDAQTLAQELHIPYFETSAKTGEGVEAAFMDLATRAVRGKRPGETAVLQLGPAKKGQKAPSKGCC